MVLATAMLDIHHGIVALAGIVAGRRIDHQRTPCLFHLTIIMHGAHLAMRHILHLEVVHALFRNIDGTRPSAAAIERRAGRISYRHTVDNQRIIVESRHLRLRGHSPDASLAFVHIVLRATDVDLHLLCLRCSDGELYFVVARQLRALSHSLRCHLTAANGRQHRGQKKSDCSHIDNKFVILCKITNYFPNSAKFARNLRTFAKK